VSKLAWRLLETGQLDSMGARGSKQVSDESKALRRKKKRSSILGGGKMVPEQASKGSNVQDSPVRPTAGSYPQVIRILSNLMHARANKP
jgi:hypothetical protein